MPRQSTTDALFEDLMIPRTPLRMKSRNHGGEHPAGLRGLGDWPNFDIVMPPTQYDAPIESPGYGLEPQPSAPVFPPAGPYNGPWWLYGGLQGYRRPGLGQFDLSGIQWGDPTATIQGAVQTAVDDGYQAFDSWVTSYLNGQSSGGKIDPVPVENQTTREVLAPVSAALQIPAVTNSVTTLQQLGTFLNNGLLKWQAFLDRVAVNYPDGARNSGARLAPYFQGLNATINADLAKLGAAPTSLPGLPGVTVPTSIFAGMSGTTMILLGVGAYFLLKRRG